MYNIALYFLVDVAYSRQCRKSKFKGNNVFMIFFWCIKNFKLLLTWPFSLANNIKYSISLKKKGKLKLLEWNIACILVHVISVIMNHLCLSKTFLKLAVVFGFSKFFYFIYHQLISRSLIHLFLETQIKN